MTFAEKLNEHNKYRQELTKQARELISQAKSDKEKRVMLIKKADRVINSLDTATQKFDTEHKEQLRALLAALGRNSE